MSFTKEIVDFSGLSVEEIQDKLLNLNISITAQEALKIQNEMLGRAPSISELVLYLPDEILSYFSSLNWSLVSKGFGNNSNKLAKICAKGRGKGNKTLFLPIRISNLCKISLNVTTSGPTHSIILELIFFDKCFV